MPADSESVEVTVNPPWVTATSQFPCWLIELFTGVTMMQLPVCTEASMTVSVLPDVAHTRCGHGTPHDGSYCPGLAEEYPACPTVIQFFV